jgi:hypothetical protein
MYAEPGFYDMVPNSIGTILYKKNIASGLSNDVKQKIVSKNANERLRALLSNSDMDPAAAYAKARKDSWGELEDGDAAMSVENLSVQIGQTESYEAICRIESKTDFGGWMNPALVNLIKEQYKNK